jgi:hypothetical protein
MWSWHRDQQVERDLALVVGHQHRREFGVDSLRVMKSVSRPDLLAPLANAAEVLSTPPAW